MFVWVVIGGRCGEKRGPARRAPTRVGTRRPVPAGGRAELLDARAGATDQVKLPLTVPSVPFMSAAEDSTALASLLSSSRVSANSVSQRLWALR